MKKLFTNLTFWVLIAITAAILVGHFAPSIALQPVIKDPCKNKTTRPGNKRWLNSQRVSCGYLLLVLSNFLSIPIIFLTITLGIVSMGDLKKVGRVGAKALLYFEIVTTFALIIGVIVALVIRPGHGIITNDIKGGDVSKYTQTSFSWLKFLKENSTLQVLIVAILFGIGLNYIRYKKDITGVLQLIAKYVFKILHAIMIFAPIGAFGGMAYTISRLGLIPWFH